MTEASIVAIVLGLVSGLGGLIIAASTALRERANAKLTAKQSDYERISTIVDQLQEENKRLLERIGSLETKLIDRDDRIEKLTDRVRELEAENNFLRAQIDELKANRQRRQAGK